ncbi:hypothetical protein SK128_010656 [Halocaridina rubra]|uniref:Uncharacterized protein n=1 Tax=Halocaridina rubra TaxID=373956 RepID=A0AAN9AAT0_HALRR
MADFIETDSPLPTPTLSRKILVTSAECLNDANVSINTSFVRKCGVRRKSNISGEGACVKSSFDDSPKNNSKNRKHHKTKPKNTVVISSYKVLKDDDTSSKESIPSSTYLRHKNSSTNEKTCKKEMEDNRLGKHSTEESKENAYDIHGSQCPSSNLKDKVTETFSCDMTLSCLQPDYNTQCPTSQKTSNNTNYMNLVIQEANTTPGTQSAISELKSLHQKDGYEDRSISKFTMPQQKAAKSKQLSISKCRDFNSSCQLSKCSDEIENPIKSTKKKCGHKYTKCSGESSEESDEENNVLGISYKPLYLPGAYYDGMSDNAVTSSATLREKRPNQLQSDNEILKNIKTISSVKVNEKHMEHEECESCLEFTSTKGKEERISPSYLSVDKDISKKLKNSKEKHKNNEKKIYSITSLESPASSSLTDNKGVFLRQRTATPPRSHLQGSSARWSMFADMNVAKLYTFGDNALMDSDDTHMSADICTTIRNSGNFCDLDLDTKVRCKNSQIGVKQRIEVCRNSCEEVSHSKSHSLTDARLSLALNRNDWKRKSGRFSFDKLVHICSETVAQSIKDCIAESPNEIPANIKDIGLERSAIIIADMIKEFIATLPSDLNKRVDNQVQSPIQENEICTSGKGILETAEAEIPLDNIRETVEFKVASELIENTEISAQDETDNAVRRAKSNETGLDEKVIPSSVTNTLVLPSFKSLEEPKSMSRRGSFDIQETSRLRLSKTGRIEVIDQIESEDEPYPLKENEEEGSVVNDDFSLSGFQSLAEETSPPSRRYSFTERFNMWRLAWKFRNDGQLSSRSDIIKNKLQQRRASGSDFVSSFDGRGSSLSDMITGGIPNKRRASTVETPRLARRNSFEPKTVLKKNSDSYLSLFRSSSDTSATRRLSMDDRLRKISMMDKGSVERGTDAFSYFVDYPVLQQERMDVETNEVRVFLTLMEAELPNHRVLPRELLSPVFKQLPDDGGLRLHT